MSYVQIWVCVVVRAVVSCAVLSVCYAQLVVWTEQIDFDANLNQKASMAEMMSLGPYFGKGN